MKEEKTAKGESVGCLPFNTNGVFEPPVKRTRRRYNVSKERLDEIDGAKLLSLVREFENYQTFFDRK